MFSFYISLSSILCCGPYCQKKLLRGKHLREFKKKNEQNKQKEKISPTNPAEMSAKEGKFYARKELIVGPSLDFGNWSRIGRTNAICNKQRFTWNWAFLSTGPTVAWLDERLVVVRRSNPTPVASSHEFLECSPPVSPFDILSPRASPHRQAANQS